MSACTRNSSRGFYTRLTWTSALVLFIMCLALSELRCEVSADPEVDADLVFDLDDPVVRDQETKSNGQDHRRFEKRHARRTLEKAFSASSAESQEQHETEESHWLTKAVHRIKRGFLDWLTPSKKVVEEVKPEDKSTSREKRNSEEEKTETTDDYDSITMGQHHEDQHSFEEEGQHDYNEVDDTISNHGGHTSLNHVLPANRGDTSRDQTDDEDFIESGSTATPTPVAHLIPSPETAQYYRVSLTINEPYTPSYEVKTSPEFVNLATSVSIAITQLYEDLPGQRHVNVVKIKKREIDSFTSLALVDIGTRDYYNGDTIKNRLYDQIQNYQRLGDIPVSTEEFTFTKFVEPQSRCKADELQCNSGECVHVQFRCDGVEQCSDGTDEMGCPTECALGELMCDVSRCIPESKVCDGVDDCNDGTDEECHDPCNDDQFLCDDRSCIEKSQRCDGIAQCRNGEDEIGCPRECNPENEFRCEAGTCVPLSLKCNRKYDCPNKDVSDELNCPCRSDDFFCEPGICIPFDRRCDGVTNCNNRADEINCNTTKKTCASYEFQCNDGTCIDQINRCNLRNDCIDASDEQNCPPACDKDQYRCINGDCLSISSLCDGYDDCVHGEDEEHCKSFAKCNKYQFMCASGDCIDVRYKCDGRRDCPDNSDEREDECACFDGQYRCKSGECIPKSKVCDTYFDCKTQDDENNCTVCTPFHFRCNSGMCIDEEKRCDDLLDCDDHSDEQNCTHVCRSHEFRCADGLCLDARRRCDGYSDCRDKSDEHNCGFSTCLPSQFRCNNGLCIANSFRCDRFNDCLDDSDELNCPKRPGCRSDEFECDETCLPLSDKCNGVKDCENGMDEQDCPRYCPINQFHCGGSVCISNDRVCDKRPDCSDGRDERECVCQGDEFSCTSGECIASSLICNGKPDCFDGSDEYNCPAPTTPHPSEVTHSPGCGHGQWKCRSGECIPASSVCDARFDCNDYSDENSCSELKLKTYPDDQIIKESREVVFQCRDEGPLRARVRWVRGGNLPLPPGSRDINGRLEMPDIQVDHTGSYICEAVGYPSSTPGSRVTVSLAVEPYEHPSTRPPTACGLYEATCSNGDCIPKNQVCDGKYDCTDGSDEMRCKSGCEPNEFHCDNKRCVLKTWRCDSDDDCGDGSDERNCATNPPGSPCRYNEFPCLSGNQCIPKSFHCDLERDCQDGSDEIGCSAVYIQTPPPPMVTLNIGDLFIITCTAIAVPTPEVVWRLNWGHIPPKCTTKSEGGLGTLTCPDIQESDQGAYSCEAINIRGSVFAVPDSILVVRPTGKVCPAGLFNNEAKSPSECIKCFCFGATSECESADLFTYQLHPPLDVHKVIGVPVGPNGGFELRDEPIYRGVQPRINSFGRHGVTFATSSYSSVESNIMPYFAMPENYNGNQLKSYGGYLKYNLKFTGSRGPNNNVPDVILKGNGYTLLHVGRPLPPDQEHKVSVRFFVGEWVKRSDDDREQLATREEIMMALASVENILMRLQYNTDAQTETTLNNIEMDSAAVRNTGQSRAAYVEECKCPIGYSGLSCENCSPGFVRHMSGPWLGKCYREDDTCQPGTYGDPRRGIACEVCPCPLTNPSNQFARTCSLSGDGQVTCDCPPGYVGRRCEQCAAGYSGNPLISGDSCKPGTCDAIGSLSAITDQDGQCPCKLYTHGPNCNQCKPNTFNLGPDNQFGCTACFCMGITSQCSSSSWYRDQIKTSFARSRNDFKLVASLKKHEYIEDDITVNSNSREITFNDFSRRQPDTYYWSLPARYLGDIVTSYGGNLKYTLRYIPTPGGLSSRNTAPDVELISSNDIKLLYFGKDQPQPNNQQTFTVPILEQYWQRSDGQKADREHLLMALADVEAILIKATYTTNTREASLVFVSLDIANERNTGSIERALAVEQCSCPRGYRGLSCEDCDVGFTRTIEGLYLGLCKECDCNGHSTECDPDEGQCIHCADNTDGEYCELCAHGYAGNATAGTPYDCRIIDSEDQTCDCDKRGIASDECYGIQCDCKANVQGPECNICRKGTFGLSASNPEGCSECFCSGVTDQCYESNLYTEQIPSQIIDENHGFTLTDETQRERISDGFQLNVAKNEIGYLIRPSSNDRLFWSLPREFTGDKVTSYGGKLEFIQRYTKRPQARYTPDKDVILIGNGITIYWSNPNEMVPDRQNNVSVAISTSENWQRLEHHSGPRRASRDDILTALANLDAILIRALQSSDTSSTYVSDITLDTAVPVYTGKGNASQVENCRCPSGYRGSSCELCETGYYRDINDRADGPLGSCRRCTCSDNEYSCVLGPGNQVICNCKPGYYGNRCETTGDTHMMMELTPTSVRAPVGTIIEFTCKYYNREQLEIIIVENGVPKSRNSDIYMRCADSTYKTWLIQVGYKPIFIQCMLKDKENFIVGVLRARLYPELPPEPVDPVSPLPPDSPTIEVTISTPSIGIIEVGTTVRLHCQTRSLVSPYTPIQVNWRKDGGSLPRDRAIDDRRGILVITDIRVSDSGVYICEATDETSIVTETITITVGNAAEAPRVSFEPIYLNVQEGDPIEIRCLATGNPRPNLVFTGGQNNRLNPEHTFQNGVFRIPYARKSDEAEYHCTATNSAGTDTKTTIIYVGAGSVTPGPEPAEIVPIISPSQYHGQSDVTFTLTCKASSNRQHSFIWYRTGAPIPYSSSQNNGVLIVYNPRPEDSGTYICNVTTTSGESASAFARVTITSASTYPAVHIEPDRQTIAQGTTAELRCIATGIPTPSVKWTKVGEEFGPNIEETGSNLRILNAQVKDRGVYVCIASNDEGLAQSSAIIEVEQREPPAVEIYPDSKQTVTSGGSAMLQCRVTNGIPTPKVWWSRANRQPFGRNVEELSGAILRFSQITMEESGDYICHAENDAGQTTAIAHIDVHTLPILTLTPSTHEYQVAEGSLVRLECRATGYPQPNVYWNKHSADRVAFRPQSSELIPVAIYEITRVSKDHEGIYVCTGTNDAGSTDERIHLMIEEHDRLPERGDNPRGDTPNPEETYPTQKPRSPLIVNRVFTVPVGRRAEMRCQVQGISDVYLNWIRADNSSLPPNSVVQDGILYIENAQPSAAGEYTCLGLVRGRIEFAVKTILRILAPPRITLTPPKQTVRPGDDATIYCDVSGDQPIQISWSAMHRPLPRSVQASGGSLRFFGIQVSDAGRYICKAENEAGDADAVAEVIVNEHTSQPTVTTDTRIQEASVGQSVQMQCRISRSYTGSRPTVRWSRDGQDLPYNSYQSEEVLHVTAIQKADAGRYICEVTNEIGSSRNYVELIVNAFSCKSYEFKCYSGECIDVRRRCDRRYDCADSSDEYNCARIRRDPYATRQQPLEIEPSSDEHHLGDILDLMCHGADPGANIIWSKSSGRFADNVHYSGSTLRITSLRPENAGVYRCEASSQRGVIDTDYDLRLVDAPFHADEPTIEIKKAPQGSTISIDCRTVLEPPVTYHWSKQGDNLPSYVNTEVARLHMRDIKSEDAGTYICKANNGRNTIELPTVLVVTGIVPFFPQTPVSYLSLPTIPDAYLSFSIEVSFKPESSNGLILYNDQNKNNVIGDFVSLVLNDGYPEFRFNCGSGPAVIRGDKRLELEQWHTIRVTRTRKEGKMYVNRQGPFVGHAPGKFQGLDLSEQLFVGGVPDFGNIAKQAGSSTGFVGCISRVIISGKEHDLMRDALEKREVTTCETCPENLCENKGVCQEAQTKEGYKCLCPSGFSGLKCKTIGETCYPGACNTGRCINKENGFDCYCPMGRIGKRCERDTDIYEPAFSDDAFVAYPTPKNRRLKMALKIKPADLKDGVLLYCAENEEGFGDFTSLSLKEGHVEFRFDVGNGPVIMRSANTLVPDEWVAITVSRYLGEGKLIVNGEPAIIGKSQGSNKPVELFTSLYVGGYDKDKIEINSGVGVDGGFHGCISAIDVSGLNLSIVSSVVESANVQDCSAATYDGNSQTNDLSDADEDYNNRGHHNPQKHATGCSSNPCRNDGQCYPLSPTEYRCSCINGYSGDDCEIAPNLCDQLQPCQNGGSCNGTTVNYKCDCPLGHTGLNCEQRADIRTDVHFTGDGYLELDRKLLAHEVDEETEVIALDISTNSSDGLIFWHGQEPTMDGKGDDFIALAVVGGYLEFSFDLGSGPVTIKNRQVRIDDSRRHSVILKRQEVDGSIEVDHDFTEFGTSEGLTRTMNCRGNIYLGGTPNLHLMTGGKFTRGFSGCIHGFELQDSNTIDLSAKTLSGVNVKPCSSLDDDDNDLNGDDIVNK